MEEKISYNYDAVTPFRTKVSLVSPAGLELSMESWLVSNL